MHRDAPFRPAVPATPAAAAASPTAAAARAVPAVPTARPALLLAVLAVLAVVATGCATDYVARTQPVRRAYEQYDYGKALERLDGLAEKDHAARDQLLYLLDRGMILHASGRWEESLEALQAAERLAARLDIVSVSEEAKVLLSNEREKAYRGEDFELLLINVLSALNYAALDEPEEALVEVRRANERLRKMVADEEKPYQQLAIARYVGGLMWEAAGEFDSAYIDYAAALEQSPDLGHLAEPLLRLARQTGRDDAYEKLLDRFPDVPHEPIGPGEGQVVVLVEAGLSPQKHEVENRYHYHGEAHMMAVPHYHRRAWGGQARVEVAGLERPAVTVTSVEAVAQKHLDARLGAMVAKSLAATAVKAGLAGAVGAVTESEDLGWLTFFILMSAQRPDLRSWLSLPAEFQVARFKVPAGDHHVEVAWQGQVTGHPVRVLPGEISLVILRRF